MSWLFHSPAVSAINNLLASEDVTLTKVIEESEFSQAVKQSNPALQEFLKRDDIMEEFLDWVLTDKMSEHPNHVRNGRQVMTAITTVSRGMQERCFKEHKVIIDRLLHFGESDYCKNPRLCGHFARIIEHYVRVTSGNYLSHFPNLKNFLIENMICVGLRDLFVVLVTEFDRYFTLDVDDVKNLVQQIVKPECGPFAVYALEKIFDADVIMDIVGPSDIICNIIEAAMSLPFNSIVACKAFQAAGLIIREYPDAAQKITELGSKFAFEIRPDDCVTAFAAMIFGKPCLVLIKSLFDVPARTFLNQALFRAFVALTPSEKAELVEKENLVEAVMNSYDEEHKINGHITELAKVMRDISSAVKGESLKSEAWEQFVEDKLNPRIEQRDSVPRDPNEDEEEEEEDNDGPFYGVSVAQDVDVDEYIFDVSSSSSSSDDSIERVEHEISSDDDDVLGNSIPPFHMADVVKQLAPGKLPPPPQMQIDTIGLPPPPLELLDAPVAAGGLPPLPPLFESGMAGTLPPAPAPLDLPFDLPPPPMDFLPPPVQLGSDDEIKLPPVLDLDSDDGGIKLPPPVPLDSDDDDDEIKLPPPVPLDSDDGGIKLPPPVPLDSDDEIKLPPPVPLDSDDEIKLPPPVPLDSDDDIMPPVLQENN